MSRVVRLVVGVVLVVIGVVGLMAWLANRDLDQQTETFAGVTVLELDAQNSRFDIVSGGDEVVVEMSMTTGLLGGDVTLEQTGDTVVVHQDCPLVIGWGCRAEFHITVPASVEVSGSTSNGAISLSSLEGPLDISTSNGTITLEDVASNAVLSTSNGSITGSRVSSEQMQVRTSNGEVSLSFAEGLSSLEVSTSNGDVELTLPQDSSPFAVSTSTSNGQVTTDIATDPAAGESIEVETSNGDIAIVYAFS